MKSGSGPPYQRIASGTLSDLDLGAGGRNHVRVVAIGDRGWLFVNGNFVSSFDLGNVTGPGLVAVVTGAYAGDEVAGAVTRFVELQGLSINQAVRPRRGDTGKYAGIHSHTLQRRAVPRTWWQRQNSSIRKEAIGATGS